MEEIPEDLIVKSFKVCGQVKDVDIDEIVAFKEGRVAESGKSKLVDLMKLDPEDIDYNSLTKKVTATCKQMFWYVMLQIIQK